MATTATSDRRIEDPIVRLQATHGGVTVEKVLVRESPGVVGVWFRLTANSRRGRRVRLAEELPSGIDHDDVGLHPEYAADDWTRASDGLEFRATVDQSPTVTLYAVRGLDTVPAKLASPPEAIEVTQRGRSLRQ